jgi:cyanophycin synthetase
MLVTFRPEHAGDIERDRAEAILRSLEFDEVLPEQEPAGRISFVALAGFLTAALHGAGAFPAGQSVSQGHDAARDEDWIFIPCLDHASAQVASKTALATSSLIFEIVGNNRKGPEPPSAEKLRAVRAHMERQLPPKSMQMLMRSADARGIPYYSICASTSFWQFGQGALGRHLAPNTAETDSHTGALIAGHKLRSNNLVLRLGYPGVEHVIVDNAAQAVRAAEKIGFPVVVKPVASGKGFGITAAITDPSEIPAAYDLAKPYGRNGVLVERHVEGTDHRIAVFGGKFAFAGAKHPARVFGNGKQSIAMLIEEENRRRLGDPEAKAIFRDEAMDRLLAKAGLDYEHCPGPGVEVRLRTVANIAMGGTWEETPAVHRDNIEMAEALSRAFRLDQLGVDFITNDITRSWRETDCAIIEVNETPGFLTFAHAERVLENMLPKEQAYRIPTLLMLDCSEATLECAWEVVAAAGRRVGIATHDKTMLGGQLKGRPSHGLHARVNSLVANPDCEALVVAARREDVLRAGLPLDRFDLAVLPPSLDPGTAALCEQHCAEVHALDPGDPDALPALRDRISATLGLR